MLTRCKPSENPDSRLLENVVLHLLLVATILEHAGEGLHTTHTTTDTCADLRWVNVLVQLVRVGDTGHVEGLRRTDESPEGRPVGLSNDVGGVP